MDFEEFAFEAFVRLLEEGQQNSPRNPVEAHPQLATQAFGFKKI